jgi:hypothetical protein
MTRSAVTLNYVRAHELAAQRLETQVDVLSLQCNGMKLKAARGSSMFSDPGDMAAYYLIDDLRKASKTLLNSAQAHRARATAFLNAPCPACLAGQRSHCASCGSCAVANRGPSCRDLECELASSRVSVDT